MKNKSFFLTMLLFVLAACAPSMTAQPIPPAAYTQLAMMATGYAPTAEVYATQTAIAMPTGWIQTPTLCPSIAVKADTTVKGPAIITVEYDKNVLSADLPENVSIDFNTDGYVNYCMNSVVSKTSLQTLIDSNMVSITVHR